MIYQVTAKIQGNSFLENNIKVNYKKFIIEIFSDKSSKVILIRVSKKILLDSMKLPEFIFSYKEKGIHRLDIPENNCYEEIINLLKYIESLELKKYVGMKYKKIIFQKMIKKDLY